MTGRGCDDVRPVGIVAKMSNALECLCGNLLIGRAAWNRIGVIVPEAADLVTRVRDIGRHAADRLVVLGVDVVVGAAADVLRVGLEQLRYLIGVAILLVAP